MWITAFIFAAAVILFKQLVAGMPIIFDFISTVFGVLSPFIIGFVIAFLLYVPCSKFEKLLKKIKKPSFISKHARGFSVLIVYILCIAIIAVLLILVLPLLVKTIIKLYNSRNDYYETFKNFVMSKCDHDGKFFGIDVGSMVENLNPNNYLDDINLSHLESIANGVYKFGSALVEALLTLFSSVYMLISRETLIRIVGRFLTLFIKREKVKNAYSYLCRIANIFYSYVYSALLDSLILATVFSIVFLILGVDYAPFFGIAVGLANLVPYFGSIIAGVCVAVFVAVTDGLLHALITVACILVIQQLDCNVVEPKIIGKNVGIHPLFTLIAITIGDWLIGFWGLIISVPVAATLGMIINDIMNWNDRRIERKKANAESGDGNDGKANGEHEQNT